MEVTNESYKEVTLFSATVISHIFLVNVPDANCAMLQNATFELDARGSYMSTISGSVLAAGLARLQLGLLLKINARHSCCALR